VPGARKDPEKLQENSFFKPWLDLALALGNNIIQAREVLLQISNDLRPIRIHISHAVCCLLDRVVVLPQQALSHSPSIGNF
jgi:hypothetical protein